MTKKLLLILSSALLLSCGSSASSSSTNTIEITDLVGRTVQIDQTKTNKVVCIGAGALRLYSYICDMDKLCGVEDIDNPNKTTMWQGVARPYYMANMEQLSSLPSCGKGGPKNQVAEAEAILSCGADIVISEYEDVKSEDDLQNKLGIPVITVKYGQKTVFDENVAASLSLLGKIFNKEARANELLSYIDNAKKDLGERTKDIKEEDKPNVYVGGVGNWGQKGLYATAANYPLFNVSNIKNIVDGKVSAPGQQDITAELFASCGESMDKMIIDAAGLENIKDAYAKDSSIFDGNKAVKEGEVYLQMAYNAYYTNLEVALMDAYYDASIVYPSCFEGFDIVGKSNEITKMFNGKALYESIAKMPSSYGGYQKIDNLKEFLSK